MAGLEREYQQAFAWGMARSARRKNVDLCIFNCQGFDERSGTRNDLAEGAIFDLPDLNSFDGVAALCYTIAAQETLHHICDLITANQELPLVTIDAPVDYGVAITFDDLTSVREMIRHLMEDHGLYRFAIVRGPQENAVARARFLASCEAIEQGGGEVEPNLVFDGYWTRSGGRAAVEEMLRRDASLPEVILCANDDMAIGVIEGLTEAGVTVPEQVRVTGFDARREAVGRGVTTIRRPVRDAGEMAVQLLTEWMDGRKPSQRVVQLPTQVIYGETCGCELDGSTVTGYVRLLSDERRAIERSLDRASSFSSALAGVSSEKEAGRVIADFAQDWGVKELHVCVSPSFLDPSCSLHQTAYPPQMLLLSSYSQGQIAPQTLFNVSELLPVLSKLHQHPLALVFSPLYYLDKNFGYAVFDLEHATSYSLYSILTHIGGALMSITLQCTVRAYAAAMKEMSIRDSLTGMYNRRAYQELAPTQFERAREAGLCFAILSVDMDGMKQINDRFGHQAGDTAICRMGRAVKALERNGLTCVHVSGDEFIALGVVTSEEQSRHIGARLQESIDWINTQEPWVCNIAASCGVYAAVPGPEDTLDEFLTNADRLMYADKASHK